MEKSSPATTTTASTGPILLPRVTIQFCTQCKWMLRAAYFAQELLSTFSLSLGEVALQPATGGVFVVTIYTQQPPDLPGQQSGPGIVLWDRKAEGGFPETKELKRLVRDVIEPGRDLGHVDRHHKKSVTAHEPAKVQHQEVPTSATTAAEDNKAACEDCQ
ncbi:Rdx family-domain-containing protein [Stachybotrys elegans]|uniref:Rdx family-domain-containing protein n=1 Tax=Stachybotrys elegans TaxID=80388 RepID=A0A8K0T108_9HYPO|nr:Rdx family-domain-containing protein [Stachybotrys elegans]